MAAAAAPPPSPPPPPPPPCCCCGGGGAEGMADCGAAAIVLFPALNNAGNGAEESANGSANSRDAGGTAPKRKARGRPLGSKNKPKPPVVVAQESEAVMRSVVLELPAGCDVLACLTAFARRRNVGVAILSASGEVSEVTLRQPGCTSNLAYRGLFDVLSLAGTFLPAPALGSHLTVSLAGAQGKVIGGVVAGELVAAGTVRLVVASFANPEIQKVPLPQSGEEEDGGMVVGAEEPGQQPLVGEPASSSAPMEMMYNVGCEVPAEAPAWSAHPGRAADTGFRQPVNHRQQFY